MKLDRFLELGAILEPGRPPKTDKAAILIDAVRIVAQLRGEAKMLKDSNTSLSEKIKELKVSLLQLSDQENLYLFHYVVVFHLKDCYKLQHL